MNFVSSLYHELSNQKVHQNLDFFIRISIAKCVACVQFYIIVVAYAIIQIKMMRKFGL